MMLALIIVSSQLEQISITHSFLELQILSVRFLYVREFKTTWERAEEVWDLQFLKTEKC